MDSPQAYRVPGLVIRFDGPPEHEAGRFVECELDGSSVSLGEWKQDGDYWVLVMPKVIEIAFRSISEGKIDSSKTVYDRVVELENELRESMDCIESLSKQFLAEKTTLQKRFDILEILHRSCPVNHKRVIDNERR